MMGLPSTGDILRKVLSMVIHVTLLKITYKIINVMSLLDLNNMMILF